MKDGVKKMKRMPEKAGKKGSDSSAKLHAAKHDETNLKHVKSGSVSANGDAVSSNVKRQRFPCEVLGDSFISWLFNMSSTEFFSKYFEKKPLMVSHGNASYFSSGRNSPKGIRADWSTERMLEAVSTKELHYGSDLNIVRLDPSLKKRVPFKTEGVVTLEDMKACMKDGWSIRFLRPHEHAHQNSVFIRLMEEVFNGYCGLNSYWTAAGSQGFAPHYDDVDVFLMQLEGKKRWRLYNPPEEVDVLSRHSSEDYSPDAMPTKPEMTLTLAPGDILYMPRGCVHQGDSLPDAHSLHITFSANQMNAWADMMKCATTYCIETLAANHISWRYTVPRTAFDVLGAANEPEVRAMWGLAEVTDAHLKSRKEMQLHIRELLAQLSVTLTDDRMLDVCVDQYAKQVMQRFQPPVKKVLHPEETAEEVISSLTGATRVRLVSHNAIRLDVAVPGEAQVHHIGANDIVTQDGVIDTFRFEADFAPAIATLITQFPKSIAISKLPFPSFDDESDVRENQEILCETLLDAGVLEVVDANSEHVDGSNGNTAEMIRTVPTKFAVLSEGTKVKKMKKSLKRPRDD